MLCCRVCHAQARACLSAGFVAAAPPRLLNNGTDLSCQWDTGGDGHRRIMAKHGGGRWTAVWPGVLGPRPRLRKAGGGGVCIVGGNFFEQFRWDRLAAPFLAPAGPQTGPHGVPGPPCSRQTKVLHILQTRRFWRGVVVSSMPSLLLVPVCALSASITASPPPPPSPPSKSPPPPPPPARIDPHGRGY